MKIFKISGFLISLLVLAACVTINIYFPAAQAEEAAGKIVDDILGKQKPEGDSPKSGKQGAALDRPLFQSLAGEALAFLIPSAEAAQPDFNASSPAIRKLQASMKSRNRALIPFYNSGAVGFTRDAMIGIHNAGAIPLKERNRVQSLVSDENRDRNALYAAIADANGHPEWAPEIRSTFARTWVDKASRGWWYQNSRGGWVQK